MGCQGLWARPAFWKADCVAHVIVGGILIDGDQSSLTIQVDCEIGPYSSTGADPPVISQLQVTLSGERSAVGKKGPGSMVRKDHLERIICSGDSAKEPDIVVFKIGETTPGIDLSGKSERVGEGGHLETVDATAGEVKPPLVSAVEANQCLT